MKIDFKNISYYYLTHNNEKRKTHMINEFKDYNLIEINPNPKFNENQYKSASSGFLKMLDVAIDDMDGNFKPFVMLEDDVKRQKNYPDEINIPDDSDLFYLGHQRYGLGANNRTLINPIYQSIDDNIVKIINILSNTAIMVCSLKGLLKMQKCMMTIFYKQKPWDIPLSLCQHTINVYSTRKELIYQYGPVAGNNSQKNTLNINYNNNKPFPSTDIIPKFVYNKIKEYPLLM